MKTDTRTLVLDAAEQEFADHGFDGAPLRQIIARAGVNAAAVLYHFGSKEELISSVFARRIGVMTEERLRLLDACETESRGGRPPLEQVLEAFVGPALRLTTDPAKGGKVFMRLFGRTLAEPSEYLQKVMNQHFSVVTARFGAAFRRALPQLPPAVLHWRFQFAVGAMGNIMADPHNLKEVTGGLCDPADTETAIRELTTFLAAGLRAPVAATPRQRRRKERA